MNILVVARDQNDGPPTAIFVHAQILAYRQLGHHVRVIVPVAFGKRGFCGQRLEFGIRQETVDGVDHIFLRYLSLSNYGKRHFNTSSAITTIRTHLHAILGDFVPDVIHAHTLGLESGIGAWLKDILCIPLVVTTHGGDTFIPYTKGELPQLKKYADRADHLVCVSTLLKRRLDACNVAIPTSVILNGFQIENTISNLEKPPLSIIQVGYLIARKKADVTIQAFGILQKKYPNAILDIVGSGNELARFQSLCENLGVSDAVHFHGFLPNAETLEKMARTHFFVMPSINEGFGIVYLEAMASGCVTIGTEGEGIADLIISGKNGFLVPPDDPESIVRIIEWCLEHPEESAAIAQQGRKDALNLTWEKNAAQYINLFKTLTGQV